MRITRNVTISVPEGLKKEMDNYPEVSWSEVCRKAISRYIAERKNPTPSIELTIDDAGLDIYHDSGHPALVINLKIHNKMETEIVVDRILFKVRFHSSVKGGILSIGSGYDMYRRFVSPNSIGGTQIFLPLPKDKITTLEPLFKSTFPCLVRCTVFVEGFRNPFNQELRTKIPIDEWMKFVETVLKKPQFV